MSRSPLVEFARVTVRYEPGAAPALEDVTFTLERGERAALIGLNGSGKTTLLMAAVGLVGYEGRIRVDGTPVERRTAGEIRRKTGFLFNIPEDQILFPVVLEDAAFGLLRRGDERREAYRKAALALEELGVAHLAEWPTLHLSHGQKQRVALAGALVTRPPLLLLDEPTAGLDPKGRKSLARLLSGLDAGMLVATHDLGFAGRLCRRFIVLDRGRIISDGKDLAAVRQAWDAEA